MIPRYTWDKNRGVAQMRSGCGGKENTLVLGRRLGGPQRIPRRGHKLKKKSFPGEGATCAPENFRTRSQI